MGTGKHDPQPGSKEWCYRFGGACDSCAHWTQATKEEKCVWGDFGGYCKVMKLQTYESYSCKDWESRNQIVA